MQNIEIVNSFWLGDTLTWLERACMRSFLRHGIRFRLYTYGDVKGIPEGVEVMDANTIYPRDGIFVYDGLVSEESKGSPAVFSNMFRYLLLKNDMGMWVDCDMYCVRPFKMKPDAYIFGKQRPDSTNNAVLLLPSDSPILADLLALFDEPFSIPPWLDGDFHDALVERFGTTEIHPSNLPWGSTGPRALSALIVKHGLEKFARPIGKFYPVRLHQIDKMFDPEVDILRDLPRKALAIHLWNNRLRHEIKDVPPKGSFLHQLWCEGQE